LTRQSLVRLLIDREVRVENAPVELVVALAVGLGVGHRKHGVHDEQFVCDNYKVFIFNLF